MKELPEYRAIRDASIARQLKSHKIPANWIAWCKTGKHGVGLRKALAVKKCLKDGLVRGYFSDIPLNPGIDKEDSMYPTFEHLADPADHADAVVEARIMNTMKAHLSEDEFWRVIEHLFIVGVEKSKIQPPFGKRLPRGWSPKRHYKKVVVPAVPTPRPDPKAIVKASPKVAAKFVGIKVKEMKNG